MLRSCAPCVRHWCLLVCHESWFLDVSNFHGFNGMLRVWDTVSCRLPAIPWYGRWLQASVDEMLLYLFRWVLLVEMRVECAGVEFLSFMPMHCCANQERAAKQNTQGIQRCIAACPAGRTLRPSLCGESEIPRSTSSRRREAVATTHGALALEALASLSTSARCTRTRDMLTLVSQCICLRRCQYTAS